MILLPAAVCAFCVALLSAIITVTYFKGESKGSISAVSRSTRFATAFFWWFVAVFLWIFVLFSWWP